jgi:3-dehydroquinate synthetase
LLKNNIVKKDLYENDLRKSLNFGHSIGHAIESAYIKSGKDILHGEAIASGMIMESYIAMQQKKITKKCQKNYTQKKLLNTKRKKQTKILKSFWKIELLIC